MERGVRGRTRRAILDAAVSALLVDHAASLGDIATAAGVGRTTLHRYFPERADLLKAIGEDALERIALATERARITSGPVLDAIDRLCQEFFDLGDVLTLLITEFSAMGGEAWENETESDRALLALIERGHREGSIDPALPADWVQQLVWTMLYGGWEHVRTNGASRHDALALCLVTLRKSLAV